jgi:hypothetical protein
MSSGWKNGQWLLLCVVIALTAACNARSAAPPELAAAPDRFVQFAPPPPPPPPLPPAVVPASPPEAVAPVPAAIAPEETPKPQAPHHAGQHRGGLGLSIGASGEGGPIRSGGSGLSSLGSIGGGAGSAAAPAPAPAAPRANVALGDSPEIRGGIDHEKVSLAIRIHKVAIQSCYQKALATDPTLKGKLTVHFTIATTGEVSACEIVNDSVHSDALAGCVTRVIRSWVLPLKTEEPVEVSYPFVFASSDSGGDDRRVRMGAIGDTAAPDQGIDSFLK